MDDLFFYVKDGAFQDQDVRHIARQLFQGVKWMKDHGYSHRDLKPENVCVDSDFNLKIIDWGFATPYEPGSSTYSYKGSGAYMAPEIRARKAYDAHKVDMFSLGTILYVLKMRDYPWKEAKNISSYAAFYKEKPDLFWRTATGDQPDSIDANFRDLLNHLFVLDSNQRFSVEDALAHDWMKKEDNFNIDAFKETMRQKRVPADQGTVHRPTVNQHLSTVRGKMYLSGNDANTEQEIVINELVNLKTSTVEGRGTNYILTSLSAEQIGALLAKRLHDKDMKYTQDSKNPGKFTI